MFKPYSLKSFVWIANNRIHAKRLKDIEQEQKSIVKGSHSDLNNRWQEIDSKHAQKIQNLEALSRFQREKIERYKKIAIDQIMTDFEVVQCLIIDIKEEKKEGYDQRALRQKDKTEVPAERTSEFW